MKITESQLRQIIRDTLTEAIDEKAKSKAQQRFFGMVHAVQKGELDADEVGSSVVKAAKSMTKKDVKDFAETKHKGLPNHVDEGVDELSIDTIDNARIAALKKAMESDYGTPERIKADWQAKNFGKTRDERLGFNPEQMNLTMRRSGTSGDEIKDRRWARFTKDAENRRLGNRVFDNERGTWVNKISEPQLREMIREAIVGILSEQRNNRSFYDYASEYQKKHGEKLPDEQLKDAAKKNDERFHKRNQRRIMNKN